MNKLLIIFLILICVIFFVYDYSPSNIEGLTSKQKFKKGVNKTWNNIKKSKLYKATGVNKYVNYLNPAKKKSKPKPPPPMMILKPASSADYSDNIISPYVGDDFESMKNDVSDYDNALNGKESKKLVSPAPIGKQYFYNTGTQCTDQKSRQLVDRYSLIDSREGVLNDDGSIDKSMFASANADLNRSTIFKEKPDYEQTLADECIPITIEPVNVYGQKSTKETHNVSVFDLNNFNKTQLGGDVSQGFTTLNMERMDYGQKTFIYSTSILGLYLLFKALQK
jgi:hypothetical protein